MDLSIINPIWMPNPVSIDWQYYIGPQVRLLWKTFTALQLEAIYNDATASANAAMGHHYRFG